MRCFGAINKCEQSFYAANFMQGADSYSVIGKGASNHGKELCKVQASDDMVAIASESRQQQ